MCRVLFICRTFPGSAIADYEPFISHAEINSDRILIPQNQFYSLLATPLPSRDYNRELSLHINLLLFIPSQGAGLVARW